MTIKKTNKELSTQQENEIAKWYKGRRSPSSGASDHDRGDVRYEFTIGPEYDRGTAVFKYTGECKATRSKQITIRKETWDKIAEEAADQGRRPCMFLRFYDNTSGRKLDLVVREVSDDREAIF